MTLSCNKKRKNLSELPSDYEQTEPKTQVIMISAAILVRNNQKTITKTLESLKSFDEVLVLDTGSTDETVPIAKQYSNVQIIFQKFTHFGPLRNQVAKLAKNDWILAIDSDEVLSDELIQEILALHLDQNAIYSLPFKNYYRKKQVKCCGWYPEEHIRLYHKQKTSFKEDHVHEGLDTKNLKIVRLKHCVHHTPYLCINDFLHKMQLYTSLFAEQQKGKKKSTFLTAFSHGCFAFLRSYFLKKGIFHGEIGFILSLYHANTAFYKYLKLREKNRCS